MSTNANPAEAGGAHEVIANVNENTCIPVDWRLQAPISAGPGALPEVLQPLTKMRHWLIWRWETTNDGKKTKVPYKANDPSVKARSNDPSTWADLQTAKASAHDEACGIGFCLLNSGLAAFDIDNCRDPDTGDLDPWARELVERVGSYTEITASGTGLRIIGYGTGKKIHRKQIIDGKLTLESYRQAERYIAMTGHVLPGAPYALEPIDDVMTAIVAEIDFKKHGKAHSSHNPSDAGAYDEVEDLIENGCGEKFGGDRSRALFKIIIELLARGVTGETISRRLLDSKNGISEHVYDQKEPTRYVKRQIKKIRAQLSLDCDKNGNVIRSDRNIRIALAKLEIVLRYDAFGDRVLIEGLPEHGPALDDNAIIVLKVTLGEKFKLRVTKEALYDSLVYCALVNKFHPVRDYLDGLKWDGKPRLDTWLTTYAGAHDSEYMRAVGALFLIAAVRRVGQPGCKFDEMPVIEQPEQGTNKSSALAILAVQDDWFSDSLPLHVSNKEAIEHLRGKWIVEVGELSGMRKAEIESVKSFLSRRTDRARLAYDRVTSEIPRQCVLAGTTNAGEYLRDTTGNRRFWPVRVQRFDTAALRRDRDQLWAEASAREAAGESIRLHPTLWALASQEQEARLTNDPYYDSLSHALGETEGKIAMEEIWTLLDVRAGQRHQDQSRRVGEAMRKLGWQRANSNGTIKVKGRLVSGWVKGEKPWKLLRPNGSFNQILEEDDNSEEPDTVG